MHAYYVGDNDLKINNQFFKTYMLTRGCYHTFLLDWLSVFPRHQINIQRMEDFSVRGPSILRKLHHFLGLGEYWYRLPNAGLEHLSKYILL